MQNGENYRALTTKLSGNNIPWHSYENKQNRPIKVMANRFHQSCMPEKIVNIKIKTKYIQSYVQTRGGMSRKDIIHSFHTSKL